MLAKTAPGSEIVWCEVDPCYVFHPCNAYETADGNITLDVVAHATMFESSAIGPNAEASAFERWTIDPQARKVQRKVIDADAQEFPRPDERRIGQPYRYAYTVGLQREDQGPFVSDSRLYKHDLVDGGKQVHDFGPGHHASEFVFVPRQAGSTEDAGWLMGYVVNATLQTTDFVMLDAANFAGPPQAVVSLPHLIPAGFHGNWVAEP